MSLILENVKAGLSNSRLCAQILTNGKKVDLFWSIDRITVVGNICNQIKDNFGNVISYDKAMDLMSEHGLAVKLSNRSYQLVDSNGYNIAYVERLNFDIGKLRIDFNPNKIARLNAFSLVEFIRKVTTSSRHVSRCDLACDLVGVDNEYMRAHRVNRPLKTEFVHDKQGRIDTLYFGSTGSRTRLRIYNKLAERQDKGYRFKDRSSWWRVELQLRNKNAINWNKPLYDMLGSLTVNNALDEQLKGSKRVMCLGLLSDRQAWSFLSRNSRASYRKLIEQHLVTDSLSNDLIESYGKYEQELRQQLLSWLSVIDVTPVD